MRRDERGAITPLALGAIGLLVLAALLLNVIGAAVVVQRQVESAADLAALAGATAVQHGRDGCASAERAASANHADLTACSVDGQVVDVRVSRQAPRMFGRDVLAHARAKAGPT